jgi:hypothetical protein
MKKDYLKKINWIPNGRRKRGRPKQDGKKEYSERWENTS